MLALCSASHLTIERWWEQIWPRVSAGQVRFHECHDLILRSHSDQPIRQLSLLSSFPLQSADSDQYELLPDSIATKFDWSVNSVVKDASHGIVVVSLRGDADNSLDAVRLTPTLIKPEWLRSAQTDEFQVAAFLGTGLTLATIDFSPVLIEPFDPSRAGDTTYWIRLAFESTPETRQSAASGTSLLEVHPFVFFSDVVPNLEDKLEVLSKSGHESVQRGALLVKHAIVDTLFQSLSASTSVVDHRISLVTGNNSFVVNSNHAGNCLFVSTEHVLGKDGDTNVVHDYVAGARTFPLNDPLSLAESIYEYLQHYASTTDTAKTKEEVTAALNAAHSNVSFVMDVLVEFALLSHVLESRFCRARQWPDDQHAVQSLRARLYDARQFRSGGYRIDFSVAFPQQALDIGPRDMRIDPLFTGRKFQVTPKTCFVLMPFAPELQPVYADHISKVCAGLGVQCTRADDIFRNTAIIEDIWEAINTAQVIIADLTGKNPNVFYEVGLAHTVGKEVVLITQSIDDVPFDLRHLRHIQYEYTPRGMEAFEQALTNTLHGLV